LFHIRGKSGKIQGKGDEARDLVTNNIWEKLGDKKNWEGDSF
jgi:hypothetical protein